MLSTGCFIFFLSVHVNDVNLQIHCQLFIWSDIALWHPGEQYISFPTITSWRLILNNYFTETKFFPPEWREAIACLSSKTYSLWQIYKSSIPEIEDHYYLLLQIPGFSLLSSNITKVTKSTLHESTKNLHESTKSTYMILNSTYTNITLHVFSQW